MKLGRWETATAHIYGDYSMSDTCALKWSALRFLYGWTAVLRAKPVIDTEMKLIAVDNCGVIHECPMDLDDSNDARMVFVSAAHVE